MDGEATELTPAAARHRARRQAQRKLEGQLKAAYNTIQRLEGELATAQRPSSDVPAEPSHASSGNINNHLSSVHQRLLALELTLTHMQTSGCRQNVFACVADQGSENSEATASTVSFSNHSDEWYNVVTCEASTQTDHMVVQAVTQTTVGDSPSKHESVTQVVIAADPPTATTCPLEMTPKCKHAPADQR